MFTIQHTSDVSKMESSIIMMAVPTAILEDSQLDLLDKFIFTIICSFHTTDPLKIDAKNLAHMSGQTSITSQDIVCSLRSLSDKGWIELATLGRLKYVVNINFTKIINKEVKDIKQHKLDV